MDQIRARNIVLGGGAIGTAAAYHLARRGEPVVLIDQFRVGHDRGSSHGAARITRHSYADPRYARRMIDAFRCWREFEADAGEAVYFRTGGVSFGPPQVGYVERVASNLDEIGVPHRRMSGAELRRAAALFAVPDTYDAVFEPDAGVLAARRILELNVALARHYGGGSTRIIEDCAIRRIDPDGDHPALVTDDATYIADRLIVAAGAWVGRLLPGRAGELNPTRQQVFYFRPPGPDAFGLTGLPIFIYMGTEAEEAFYGLPACFGCGVKVARHAGPPVDPDAAGTRVDPREEQAVRHFLRTHVPAIAELPLERAEVCLYTVAPGEEFLVGALPERPDVIVASPCSGHGFKFSNLIGRIVAEMATDGRSDVAGDWLRSLPAAPAR